MAEKDHCGSDRWDDPLPAVRAISRSAALSDKRRDPLWGGGGTWTYRKQEKQDFEKLKQYLMPPSYDQRGERDADWKLGAVYGGTPL